ncbi:class III aminotransferase [Kitasatospora sp. MMS16-BH015]|uniref:aspartate aminotransferase family protein n=1 Tax=Kitasatospora sp. MMS16-BH015 TaxID=2018025 RepID=UPI000CA179EB|nr:aminotransferase class III-fold pyridoxal phosphate-dependent enzyme [Kitasatospora sp. MMS16-BH015]AUG80443.1 class III aminotransferase [Kitasatospora sp. MMS16-BH015]
MTAADAPELDLVEPHMLGFLTQLGIDVEYVRAEGNTLWYRDRDGREIPVVDYAGGYGALVLGHNHPELVATAQQLLADGTPILAQASLHPYASRVGAALNTILQREFPGAEPYFTVFANSGAESVEVAVKHAELDRVLRVQALFQTVEAETERARAAVAAGQAGDPAEFDRLLAEVTAHNAELAGRAPLFLTPEGSFHGKLVASVQLTYNAAFRTPFAAMAAPARFVPLNEPGALAKIVEAERVSARSLAVADGTVRVVEHEFPLFCAFVLEVIQGEGGIRPVSEEFAREIEQVCAEIDCPIVVDEIQSGLGRTGAFFAASHLGLRADYITLAKGLGGGIAKTSATLIRAGRYRKEFELLHSSTFAKDTFSSALALRVLELLEADGGAAYRLAERSGERLLALFEALRREFPEVVTDVRGRGLMIGLEFRDQSAATAAGIREAAQSGVFGYVLSGFLLRAHRIRTFPTASAVNTLRFEPSVHLSQAEIDQLETALRDLCAVLARQDEHRLFQG